VNVEFKDLFSSALDPSVLTSRPFLMVKVFLPSPELLPRLSVTAPSSLRSSNDSTDPRTVKRAELRACIAETMFSCEPVARIHREPRVR
jgi:hypothetical protein